MIYVVNLSTECSYPTPIYEQPFLDVGEYSVSSWLYLTTQRDIPIRNANKEEHNIEINVSVIYFFSDFTKGNIN